MVNKISIVVPVFNGFPHIVQLLSVLSKLNNNISVLFIDSGSTDGSVELLKNNQNVSLVTIDSLEFDHGGTRSLAKDLCNGDIVIFLTQDALPLSPKDFQKLISPFKDESVGASYGCQLAYEDANLFGRHLREFNYPNTSRIVSKKDHKKYGVKTAQLSNSFAAYRRTAMDEIGWFKNGLILGEDVYAGAKLLKAGYKLAYIAEAQVYHSHNYTTWEEFKRYFDIGAFHRMEQWILNDFGTANKEGNRYIKSEWKYLLKNQKFLLIPSFIIRNTMKLIGYKLGRHYSKLPKAIIRRISMHSRWWVKHWEH